MKIHTTIYKMSLIKKSNLDLIKSLDLPASLQEMWGQKHVNTTKIQLVKYKCGKLYRTSSPDKLQDKNKVGGETSSLRLKDISTSWNKGLYLDPDRNLLYNFF